MGQRQAVTKKRAVAYRLAARPEKSQIPDELWSWRVGLAITPELARGMPRSQRFSSHDKAVPRHMDPSIAGRQVWPVQMVTVGPIQVITLRRQRASDRRRQWPGCEVPRRPTILTSLPLLS